MSIQHFQSAIIAANRVVPGGGSTLIKHEDFAAAVAGTHPISDLSGWTDRLNNINTGNSGTTFAYPASAAAQSLAYYSSGASSENQTVDGTLQCGAAVYIGPAVRVQSGAVSAYYVYTSNSGDLALEKLIASSNTNLVYNAGEGLVTGNKIRLVVTGSGASTRLTVYKDVGSGWVAVSGMSNIDPGTYLGSGYGGIMGYGSDTGQQIDDWNWYND